MRHSYGVTEIHGDKASVKVKLLFELCGGIKSALQLLITQSHFA